MGQKERDSALKSELEGLFPRLQGATYQITSSAQPDYNCIAWAAEDDSRWWEPDAFGLYYWPEDVPRQYTLQAYAEAFRQLGYEACENPAFENGWQKAAIFVGADGIPTHAARQLADGSWTSKLGQMEDIQHPSVDHLSGPAYGRPILFLRRQS